MDRSSALPPLRSSAPGKLVLLGEYAVLTGAPAWVTAVDRRAQVTLAPAAPTERRADARFRLRASEVGVRDAAFTLGPDGRLCFDERLPSPGGLAVLQAVLSDAWRRSLEQGREPRPLAISIDTSELFRAPGATAGQKLGLGSSAAVTVCLLRGLVRAWGLRCAGGQGEPCEGLSSEQTEERIMLRLACDLHQRAQGGAGSGIDVAAALLGGSLRYQLVGGLPAARQLHWPVQLGMLPVWSGRAASTPALLQAVRRFAQQRPRAHAKLLASMADISTEALAALASGELGTVVAAFDAYGALLAELGRRSQAPIVTPEHEAIAACVRSQGAAYKPSGAGGGDLGVALWAGQHDDVEDRLRRSLGRAGFPVVPLRPAAQGCTVDPLGEGPDTA
jgi:phosphomevalonate kinase